MRSRESKWTLPPQTIISGDPSNPPGAGMIEPVIEQGICHVLFAFDVGFAIDINEAERRVTETKQRESMRHRRRAPDYFAHATPPLRVTLTAPPVEVGSHQTEPGMDIVLYDFGAVSVTFRIVLSGPLSRLQGLAQTLYDHAPLRDAAFEAVTRLTQTLGTAVSKPRVSSRVEDYVVYQVSRLFPTTTPADLMAHCGTIIAQTMRAEAEALSDLETRDALSSWLQYGRDDLTLVDWNAALVMDKDADPILGVLEYANVEMLEMRELDDKLDESLGQSHDVFARRDWFGAASLRTRAAELRRVAELQLDGALLFEGVNNALKLLGDQYLARVYRLAARRLHLDEWDASILRKLNTLESLYQKLANEQSGRRMEVLEWIIIILIAVSIVLPFLPGGAAK